MEDSTSRFFAAEIGEIPEVDLHELPDTYQGMQVTDQAIHDVFMQGEDALRIIHGRGTGKMREAIHKLLDVHKLVEQYQDSTRPEELLGVTYALLVKKD